uniref:Ovule protein n=1 Tax=Schistosoma mansoni TaxID=6183 RepID=A0A5K4F8C2_SCHMA
MSSCSSSQSFFRSHCSIVNKSILSKLTKQFSSLHNLQKVYTSSQINSRFRFKILYSICLYSSNKLM